MTYINNNNNNNNDVYSLLSEIQRSRSWSNILWNASHLMEYSQVVEKKLRLLQVWINGLHRIKHEIRKRGDNNNNFTRVVRLINQTKISPFYKKLYSLSLQLLGCFVTKREKTICLHCMSCILAYNPSRIDWTYHYLHQTCDWLIHWLRRRSKHHSETDAIATSLL